MSEETPRVLSLLSHELRGPLGVVRGYLRLLDQSSRELSDDSRDAVAAALRASQRIADVLEEASLLAHLRLGDITIEPKRTALATVVHAAIQAAALPEESRVELDAAAMPAVTLEADEPRLRSALATFITTVARAQTSQVAVEIQASRARLGRRQAVRLRIAPRTLSGVEATEVDLNAGRGGLGLSLPIAACIVERHGGRVRELRHGEQPAGLAVTLPVG